MQSVVDRRQAWGDRHPAYAAGLDRLAEILWFAGDRTQAMLVYEKARAIRRTAFGERHFELASTSYRLALLHEEWGDHDLARQQAGEALALSEAFVMAGLPFLPERQRLAFLAQSSRALSLLLDVTGTGRDDAREAYRHLLAWKGVATEAAAAQRATAATPELRVLAEELSPRGTMSTSSCTQSCRPSRRRSMRGGFAPKPSTATSSRPGLPTPCGGTLRPRSGRDRRGAQAGGGPDRLRALPALPSGHRAGRSRAQARAVEDPLPADAWGWASDAVRGSLRGLFGPRRRSAACAGGARPRGPHRRGCHGLARPDRAWRRHRGSRATTCPGPLDSDRRLDRRHAACARLA